MRSRGLLDQLLMAALDRAVALAQVDHVPVRVGKHLDLDMAGVVEVALDVDAGVGEELLALARGALEGLLEVVRGTRHPKALAAAASGGLAGDRVAGLVGSCALASSTFSAGLVAPGTIGTPASAMISRARVFEPIASIALAGGPMNATPASSHAVANATFSASSVTGMDGLGAAASPAASRILSTLR